MRSWKKIPIKESTKPEKLKVFEAFSGIGAQNAALKKIGINYKVVGTSDWFVNAIIAYDALHCSGNPIDFEIPSTEKQIQELEKFNFSIDSQKPLKDIKSLSADVIQKLYIAHKRSKNYGSITDINADDLPRINLLIYSFPCQDLSTGGNGDGMKKNSGTRSSMIWHIGNILKTLGRRKKLPEYLLMENVPAIASDRYKKDFAKWKGLLSRLGYKNDWTFVLDASKFGVPQDRCRLFMVSHLGSRLNVYKKINQKEWDGRIEDFLRFDYSNPKLKAEADEASLNLTPSREVMWKINKREPPFTDLIHTITCNMDRTHCAALFKYGDKIRRPTIREAFLLMGFSEEDYEKVDALGFSYRQKNKLIGNAIVVPVLEEVFRAMFHGTKYMANTGADNSEEIS